MSEETILNKIAKAEYPPIRNQRFETQNLLGDAVAPWKNTTE